MKNLNPVAVNLWLLGAAAGYTANGVHGCAWGLVITSAITLVIGILR
jgi:hypothetical protein